MRFIPAVSRVRIPLSLWLERFGEIRSVFVLPVYSQLSGYRFHACMRICNQKAEKRAPIHEQKELRCSAAKSIEDAFLRMARGNYVDHVIMQLSVKFKKKWKRESQIRKTVLHWTCLLSVWGGDKRWKTFLNWKNTAPTWRQRDRFKFYVNVKNWYKICE